MLEYDPAREEAELRAYLGDRFDRSRLERYAEGVEAEAARLDPATLYRTSEAYLYDLTAFAMTRTKEAYLNDLAALVEPPARLLDFGCGIGSDGLLLLEAGFEVLFADFDNPSTRYLRWRLRHRGLRAEIHDLDAGPPPGLFDAAFAFDVLEHVEDPFATLAELEDRADLVVVNLLEPGPHEASVHLELPVRALLRHAARHDVRIHRIVHGRSHVLAYAPVRVGLVRRLVNRALLR